jgi:polysaccharide export outer membrane protein
MRISMILRVVAVAAAFALPAAAQTAQPQAVQHDAAGSPAAAEKVPEGITPPSDYLIGPDDHLTVMFWREKDLSADVIVRPDGKISLPLLNDVQAAGLTPEQLREKVTDEAKRYVEDPVATVVVRQINSRKVFITGQVEKPGPYPLTAPTTVLQLISTAGGLKEYAKRDKIVIMRTENGKQTSLRFNYDQVIDRKNLKQNVELKPGDTVLVP